MSLYDVELGIRRKAVLRLKKENKALRKDLKVVAKAVDFFLEDGIAEDSPELNQYAYQRLVEVLDLPSVKRILSNDHRTTSS